MFVPREISIWSVRKVCVSARNDALVQEMSGRETPWGFCPSETPGYAWQNQALLENGCPQLRLKNRKSTSSSVIRIDHDKLGTCYCPVLPNNYPERAIGHVCLSVLERDAALRQWFHPRRLRLHGHYGRSDTAHHL